MTPIKDLRVFLSLSLVFVTLNSGAEAGEKNRNKFIDLTYALNNETMTWPGRKSSFNVEFEGLTKEGFWVASRGFCTSEHTSTHIDAPFHFNQNGRTLDQIPLEDLIDIPGVMIDIYEKVHKFKDGELSVVENYVLTREDILEWENKNGIIPQGAVVLLRTGWASRWGNSTAYRGEKHPKPAQPSGDSNNLEVKEGISLDSPDVNFPGYDGAAAKLLAVERQVIGVGIDVLSIDAGNNSRFYPAHRVFAARSIWMLEMVANLHLLPPRGFNLWVVPFKIDRGTGAPTRVLARLTHNNN